MRNASCLPSPWPASSLFLLYVFAEFPCDVLLKAAQQLSGLALFASRKSREQLTSACLAATFIGVSAPKETAGIIEELNVLSLVYTVNC